MKKEEIKKAVREGYARFARQDSGCCASGDPCCGGPRLAHDISKKIGYSAKELETVPEIANLGLGCGNPVALASLREGEVVLDLGSGAGFDCFLASNKVGENGTVIGVDMTPEMIEKARKIAASSGYRNAEFRLGEIENLPVADNSVDVVISNCVINLSTDKGRVFREVFRVLRPGGRIMVADLVLLKQLPESIRNSIEGYVGCLSGAMMRDAYMATIESAGFRDVEVIEETAFSLDCMLADPQGRAVIEGSGMAPEAVGEVSSSVVSVKVSGVKSGGTE
ncbi:arsenite S-adenosylmethyltransferase [candidate division TA06 bacterium SM23_40]|uniref:Arsenite methyltransferase n=1 Tax=candidate division TA06 bacterium SM23_40 TaxID=1703774 RepID=A0A0S8G4V3_UNCT6|nr:MAG: arsenite S-adenosylmethyltransferase [candidate division TA06 bacterium SM23_40]